MSQLDGYFKLGSLILVLVFVLDNKPNTTTRARTKTGAFDRISTLVSTTSCFRQRVPNEAMKVV